MRSCGGIPAGGEVDEELIERDDFLRQGGIRMSERCGAGLDVSDLCVVVSHIGSYIKEVKPGTDCVFRSA
jgi:hypothetical protein